jgi:DMSO/TMAO reductase YedYZ heme-binding membrane subunit
MQLPVIQKKIMGLTAVYYQYNHNIIHAFQETKHSCF